jgi:GT2 family glycosyltransferase
MISQKISNKISIVICTYNGYDLTNQLLGDIKNKCHGVHEVVVVNNGSTEPDVMKGLEFWKKMALLPLRRITLEENIGFGGGFTTGIKAATGNIIVAISNDVRIYSPEFLKYVEDGIEHGSNIVGGRLLSQDTGWNRFGNTTIPYLEGWLLGATDIAWDDLGYFDERYGLGDFEDVDLSYTAAKKGYDFTELPHGCCEHLGARTFGYNPERAARTIENQEKFREKWSLEYAQKT